ncbi:hypothetical protein BDZ94DRAFT_1272238 [Collybia nuda]|uniref:Uncharacterized protein n=1 Tax=Collybia nuda TaxID=64659 RepID=A0A9P5XUH2_9AGAR|nr:hypothetical protein BDZ94DRAFT_1272238 [Collybia nuda]
MSIFLVTSSGYILNFCTCRKPCGIYSWNPTNSNYIQVRLWTVINLAVIAVGLRGGASAPVPLVSLSCLSPVDRVYVGGGELGIAGVISA